MKKILITGAGGYIGSIAALQFLEKGYKVVGIDNFSTGYKEPIQFLQKKFSKDKLRYYEIDLRGDLSLVFRKEKDIAAVVHYAAYSSVDESMKNPIKYFKNNVCGSLNLLSFIEKYKINNIVFSSTCAVYGEAKYVPIDEKHPTKPANPYGESKLMVEKIIEWNKKLHNLNYIILRYFNVCGASEGGLIGDSKKPSVHLVQNAVRSALGIENFYLTCQKVNTPDKTPIRDYVNVIDLNSAHIKAVEYLIKGGESNIINLGTKSGNSVLEVINKVSEVTGKKLKLKKGSARMGEYAKMVADISKAKEILQWEPKRTIEDSVKSLAAWYKKHPYGWKNNQ